MRDEAKSKAQLVSELASLHQQINALKASCRETEERFAKIFAYSNDAIFLIDPERDEILDVNPRACAMLGYSREELLALGISSIHPNEMPQFLAFTTAVLEQGHSWTDRLTCLTKTKDVLPAEISASVVEINCRRCIIASVRDVTERRRAEVALRSVVEGTASATGYDFFRSLVRHLASALGVQGAFVTACTDSTLTRGRTLAYWQGDRCADNFEYAFVGTPCEKVISGGITYYPEGVHAFFPKKEGVEAYLGVPLYNSTGEILGHVAVEHDEPLRRESFAVSIMEIFAARAGAELERQQTEEALRESEQRYRSLYHNTPVMMHSIDGRGKLISVNEYWLEALGYEREEVIGRKSTDFLSEASQRYAQEVALPEFLRTGVAKDVEYQMCKKNGEEIDVLLTAVALRDEEGELSSTMAFIVDVTDRKRAEDRIHHEAARADALARVAARLNAHLTLDAVLNAVCEETARALDAPVAVVLLHDKSRSVVDLAATYGLPSEFSERFEPNPLALFDLHPWQHNPLVVLADVQGMPDLPNVELYARFRVRTVATAGLIREDEAIGTLNVCSFDQPRTFTGDDLVLLKGLADQATQAIENARLRQRAEQAAVMEERERLARELHDSVTQSLYSATLLAEAWRRLARAGRLQEIDEPFAEMGEIIQQALKEMRLLVHELRPPALERQGLLGALRQRLGAVEERAGVEVHLLADLELELPSLVEKELYRVAQEALNNAIKHAAATVVTLRLQIRDGYVELEIVDDGRGFDPDTLTGEQGIGLSSMEERVKGLGGTLTIRSAPGEGTRVQACLDTGQLT